MSGAITNIGHCLGAVFLGETVGYVTESITDRVRQHRGELGGPQTGAGSGNADTLLDVSLDVLTQVVLMMLGIKLATKGMTSIEEDLSPLIFFMIGLSNQTSLPRNLNRLTKQLMSPPDPLVVPNQA